MPAATQARNTPRRDARLLSVPVKAATKIFQGTLVARDADGWAVPAADTAALVVLGVATADADNSAGASGDLNVSIERACFRLANDAGTAVTKAGVGAPCYVLDDQTVSGSPGTNGIKAGDVVEVDDDGVWVSVGLVKGAVAKTALGNANGEISAIALAAETSTDGTAAAAADLDALKAEAEKIGDDVRDVRAKFATLVTKLEELADDFRAFVALQS